MLDDTVIAQSRNTLIIGNDYQNPHMTFSESVCQNTETMQIANSSKAKCKYFQES